MGWHRNHAISHSPNQIFFEDTFVSHPGGPNEQFGTHEKLSWGGVQGNLNWMPGYILVCITSCYQTLKLSKPRCINCPLSLTACFLVYIFILKFSLFVPLQIMRHFHNLLVTFKDREPETQVLKTTYAQTNGCMCI